MQEKYITLKEASKLSGYSPDYLGQLIRKGKLSGKQVYLNVAWMTTEEAVTEYLGKNKPGVGKAGLGTTLKERSRQWIIAHSSGDAVIRLARRVIYIILAILIILCLFLMWALIANMFRGVPAHAASGIPKVLSYQGRLFDAGGNLLGGSGASYCFRFSIYDALSGGSKLWPSTTSSIMTATVKNGVFNIGVGDVAAGGDALTYDFQATDTVYLSVDVATKVDPLCTGGSEVFETLSPRERIVASGYAINSYSVGGFVPAQNASGTQIPVLASGNLILGGTNPQINALGTSTLTLQGGTGTGAIQFFSANNFINASGTLTVAGRITGSMLQSTATSSQFIFQGTGASGTLSWNPSTTQALTIPNFLTATDTVALTNFAQTFLNKTLSAATINSSTINTSTLNAPILNAPTVFAGMSIIQNAAATGLILTQNATGTALAITNAPSSTQSVSTVSINAGANVSGGALLVANFGSGNALQINDASSSVLTINSSGNAVFQPSNDTSTAFALKNASGTTILLSADTLNNIIKVGDNSSAGSVPTLLGLDKKSDAGDPTGFDGAMYYSSSSARFRCFQGGAWANCVPAPLDYQQHFITSRWGYWSPLGTNQNAFTAVNMVAPVVNGTPLASAQAEDFYVQWTSGAVSGNSGGVTSTLLQTEMRYTPRAATRIRTDTAITTRRIWFALNSAAIVGTDGAGALATTYVGLRYSTNASDTTWKCGSGDGTTGSVIDTGVTVTTSTYYDLILDATIPGQLTCQVAKNGGSYVSVTKSTNISTSSVNLGITDTATTLAASAVVHRSAYVYVGGRGN